MKFFPSNFQPVYWEILHLLHFASLVAVTRHLFCRISHLPADRIPATATGGLTELRHLLLEQGERGTVRQCISFSFKHNEIYMCKMAYLSNIQAHWNRFFFSFLKDCFVNWETEQKQKLTFDLWLWKKQNKTEFIYISLPQLNCCHCGTVPFSEWWDTKSSTVLRGWW